MPTILCYGDSLTWGHIPITEERYSPLERWPKLLQSSLGPSFEVVEEGLGGRTLNSDDPRQPGRNGLLSFYPTVQTHLPFEFLVLFLGSNSTKTYFHQTIDQILADMRSYFQELSLACVSYQYPPPQVVLISPPDVDLKLVKPGWGFDQSSASLLKQIDVGYKDLASQFSAHFLSGYQLLGQGTGDGVHLSLAQNQLLSQELFKLISSP